MSAAYLITSADVTESVTPITSEGRHRSTGAAAVRSSGTATAEEGNERALVLSTGAGVDDGVHHTVAVAQPEDDLEEPGWRSTGPTERFYG